LIGVAADAKEAESASPIEHNDATRITSGRLFLILFSFACRSGETVDSKRPVFQVLLLFEHPVPVMGIHPVGSYQRAVTASQWASFSCPPPPQ
jgi:hypothetical protein